MKRFKFRLDSVLNIREVKEVQARESLAAAVRRLAEAEQAVSDAVARQHALATEIAAQRQGRFRASEQTASAIALDHCCREAEVLGARRAEALRGRNQAHAEWRQRRMQLQVIEQLKERDQTAHQAHANRVEQSQLDEFASLAAARALFRS
tara:strand:- start:863 stop:1315 length:453 start_codon:yes stop_codon:yes gene_type:complete